MKRRDFFKNVAGITGALVVAPLMLTTLKAQAEESRRKKPDAASTAGSNLVDPKDATAKAVGYVEVSKIKDKNCANCTLFVKTGTVNGKDEGTCAIFQNKKVPSLAYCNSWAKKA